MDRLLLEIHDAKLPAGVSVATRRKCTVKPQIPAVGGEPEWVK